jgi:phosphatidate cytidylyltransferase
MKHLLFDMSRRLVTAIIAGGLFWIAFLKLDPIYFSAILTGILFTIIIFEWTRFFAITKPMFWLVLPLYPALPFALLIMLNQSPLYHNLLMVLFAIVFSFDTGSYIVGILIGKHKLAPSISPNKTWEGLLGGYIFGIAGLQIASYELGIPKMFVGKVIFTVIIGTLSLLGDLFESWLKRLARIKDSGNFLPGHGGFLDRFDGILFAVVFVYAFRDYIMQFLGLWQ